jgi:pimeloyl-ACP methyl ester carboxylesterase
MAIKLAFDYFPAASREVKMAPLIILHGLFGNKNNWRSIAKLLCKNRPVFTMDLRNHGSSPHHNNMSLKDMAADLLFFMENNKVSEEYSLLGHSLGGKVCMSAALLLSKTHQEDLIKKLIVCDMAPLHYPRSPEIGRCLDAMCSVDLSKAKTRGDVRKVLSEVLKNSLLVNFLMTNLMVSGTGDFYWRINLESIRNSLDELFLFPFKETHVTFKKPTFFIYSSSSGYVKPLFHKKSITSFFPKSELQEMNAGHWLHIEKPQEFIGHVNSFLGSE